MKRYFLFFILICNSYLIFAQISDNFSDGDFLNNPSWIGNITRFEVDSQETLHSLIDSVNGESYLVTESKVTFDAVGEFDVFLDFNPSSSVFWNGVDKNNNSVDSGIYVFLFEVLSDDGFINQYKKVFVLQN